MILEWQEDSGGGSKRVLFRGVAGLAEGQADTNPTPAHKFCFSASTIS